MQRILLVIFIFSACNAQLRAQVSCSCNQYYALQNGDDSTVAATLIKSSIDICKAKGYQLMGSFMVDAGELDSAEYFLQNAENIYKKTGCSDSVLLYTYKNRAQLYYTKADFAKSQEYSLMMLHCAELAGNAYEQALCNTMIAQLFNQTGQAEKGIVYTRKAVLILDRILNLSLKNTIIYSLSKRYLWHYQDTKSPASLDSSEIFSRMQIVLALKLNNNGAVAKGYSNLQGVEFEKGNLKKALSFLDSSFMYMSKTAYEDLRVNYFDKADILLELKEYDEAARLADSALHYDRLIGNSAFVADSYELGSRIAKGKGDFKKAFELKELARSITDSIRNVTKTAAVSELEKKYNQAKNENTISQLDRKKQLYLFLAISGFLTAVAVVFFLRQQSLKHKKNILETEQRLNRARMNPHFFFNALTSLQQFALRGNDGQALASNLSKFSHIMRETLESTYKEYVSIEQEMEFLNEYLEVQKIRFPETFSFKVSAADQLEINELLIPSMIIQPFVENSIEHGFAGIDYPGQLSVFFNMDVKEILIEIKDNGKGLSTNVINNGEHISRASQIIKDRIYLLNIKLKTKAGFSIANDDSGKGVLVKIHLPLIYKDQQNN